MKGISGSLANREPMLMLSKDGTGILAGRVHVRTAGQLARERLFGFVGSL